MELEEIQKQELLDVKNNLNSDVLAKYRLAGQIAQSALVYVQMLLHNKEATSMSVGDICRLGDDFLRAKTQTQYKKKVSEKGIALPVQIEKTSFDGGVAPEEPDTFQGGYVADGDVVKVSLGVHIDGYVALASHTIVVQQEQVKQEPKVGTEADAIVAAHVASEAVISLLATSLAPNHPVSQAIGQVNGTHIRQLVQEVAAQFRVQIVPGSRVRRIRRFLAGQDSVVQESDFKGVVWTEDDLLETALAAERGGDSAAVVKANAEEENADVDVTVETNEAWLVDIKMAATDGKKGVAIKRAFTGYDQNELPRPTIYSRDYGVRFNLKSSSARQVLSRTANERSVFPFKLSYLARDRDELNVVKLGLGELVDRHLFVAQPIEEVAFVPLSVYMGGAKPSAREIKKSSSLVTVAREMSTVLLVPAATSESAYAECVRLTGGEACAPSPWVHSKYQVEHPSIKQVLGFRGAETGIKYQDVHMNKQSVEQALAGAAVAEDDEVMED